MNECKVVKSESTSVKNIKLKHKIRKKYIANTVEFIVVLGVIAGVLYKVFFEVLKLF